MYLWALSSLSVFGETRKSAYPLLSKGRRTKRLVGWSRFESSAGSNFREFPNSIIKVEKFYNATSKGVSLFGLPQKRRIPSLSKMKLIQDITFIIYWGHNCDGLSCTGYTNIK